MTREVVTSENREDFMKKKLGIEDKPKNSINVDDREIPVTMHPVEEKQGHQMHHVNVDKFEEAFKKNKDQYIGEKGEGGIGKRYEGIEKFLKDAKSMRASEAHVNEHGTIIFGDGRHRYAYLRDKGLKIIPMSMSKEASKNDKKHVYLY